MLGHLVADERGLVVHAQNRVSLSCWFAVQRASCQLRWATGDGTSIALTEGIRLTWVWRRTG